RPTLLEVCSEKTHALQSVAGTTIKPNIHHRDTESRTNPRTAENTEKVQGRMEIDENLREREDFKA
ncbi:MAG TPA: hypothetical protein VKD65_16565, partial [Candidatus Angelobacter sp.]|nr:hypothetical protein [Candidatus Angelobacter sp.]